ncbi:2526_t:CDS:2 [Funneliformis caledonium]|uniref:2526_t:CDS:1 n=1 Tax=Funneliformis caledonium TaxID=1117310 RepID=A0A9N8VNU5_9GLOM|nr:2526_t:CDS:2 [Funneliformis caledonium]
MAGYHTTGVAIPYTILSLTQNHNVQTKLQEEIDKTLEGRLPTLDDLSKMEYLTQVVKESLRVHPPAAFCARLLKSETILPTLVESKGFKIPANTTLIYPIPLFHENPEFFSEPEKFDPTRFSHNKIKDFTPNAYCPFGFGARICPAEKIAMVDVKMMICLIMQKFNVELAMKLEDVVKEERFVVMAKNDIIIKLIPRERINLE